MRPVWLLHLVWLTSAVSHGDAAATLGSMPRAIRRTRCSVAVRTRGGGGGFPQTAALVAFATLPQSRAVAAGSGVALLAAYHYRLVRRERRGVASWRTSLAAARARWAEHVFRTGEWTYAVQTIRNSMSTLTFLTTTVLSLFTAVMAYYWQQKERSQICGLAPESNLLFSSSTRLGATACMLLVSAYSFIMANRLMMHVGFIFPIAADVQHSNAPDVIGRDVVAAMMVNSEHLQWRGTRALYLAAAAMIEALFGEWAFFGAAIYLVDFLGKADAPPPTTAPFAPA